MTKLSVILAAVTLAVAPFAFGAGSGPMSGGGDTGGMTSAPRMTPQQMAARSYNAGLKHKERAQDYEAKAAEAKDDKDKQKQLGEGEGPVRRRDRRLPQSHRLRQSRVSGDERTRLRVPQSR